MNREDFPILKKDFIYFDNGATTLKPKCVVDALDDYYLNYTANAHRGDYDNSQKVDMMYEEVRGKVTKLIHNQDPREIVFTYGTTDSMNMVVFGFMEQHLKAGDEVLLTKAEHASNVLPWIELSKKIGIIVRYIPLTSDNQVTLENVKTMLTEKTKVISIAHVTNVIGDVRPVKKIGALCKEKNIYFVVDGAQSVPHLSVDVIDSNIDFLAFSSHKMLGPTGVGVLYGKLSLLEEMIPTRFGGGMNSEFDATGLIEYKSVPTRFEAGTPPIAGVIGLGRAIDYLLAIGMDKIHQYELELKEYLLKRLKEKSISSIRFFIQWVMEDLI